LNKSNLIGVDLIKNNEIKTKTDIIKNIHNDIKSIINSSIKQNLPNDDSAIEILTIPKPINLKEDQKNIGINLDSNLIFKILSKKFRNVLVTEIQNKNDLYKLVKRKPNLVFSGIKYFNFDERKLWLNEFLDIYGIRYITSNKSAYDNEHDKSFAKKIMQKANIKTSCFFIAKPGKYKNKLSIPLDFPLFVKPIDGGDSRGIDKNSIVYNFKNFKKKVLEIHLNQKSNSIVESYLSGKEYSVGIMQNNSNNSLLAMPIEIITKADSKGHRILDYNTKKNDAEEVIAVINSLIHKQLCELAKKAFKALNGNLIGRIDIKMDENNIPYFMEANLMPGLKKGYFYRSCSINLNINYEQMILRIAQNALRLSDNKPRLDINLDIPNYPDDDGNPPDAPTPIGPEVQKLIDSLDSKKVLV